MIIKCYCIGMGGKTIGGPQVMIESKMTYKEK